MAKNNNEIEKSLEKIVQKSLPLFALWKYDITLTEFKILDTYLSKINSHDPDTRVVLFEKGELENIMGVSRIRTPELKEKLKHLMGTVVELPDEDESDGFRVVTLFEEAKAEQDENGIWQVKLACTQPAIKYFFNIENIRYLRYKLKCITSITSRYAYILFTYLEHNRYKNSWIVDLEELKEILACQNEETYKEYKRFNDRLLKRVQKELHEKTECRFEYEAVRKGRSVAAIKFIMKPIDAVTVDDVIPEDNVIEYDDTIPGIVYRYKEICNSKFTINQLASIHGALSSCVIPDDIKGSNDDEKYFYYFQKIISKFALVENQAINSGAPIKNPVQYIIKMIENDSKNSVAAKETANKKTVPERREQSYDIEEFEKLAVTFSGNTKKARELEEEEHYSPTAVPETITNHSDIAVESEPLFQSISREELDQFLNKLTDLNA